MPHGLDAGVALVEHKKKRRCSEAVCQHVAVKTFPDEKQQQCMILRKTKIMTVIHQEFILHGFVPQEISATTAFLYSGYASLFINHLAHLALRSIHISSCWVMFWCLHSVKFATMTPGLKEHVFARIPSFLTVSFLKSRKPM